MIPLQFNPSFASPRCLRCSLNQRLQYSWCLWLPKLQLLRSSSQKCNRSLSSNSVPQRRRPPLPPMPRILPKRNENRIISSKNAANRRKPLPPPPRVLPGTKISFQNTAVPNEELSFSSKLRLAWSNGNVLIYLGWTGISVLLVDQYLQMTQKETDESAEDMVRVIQQESARIKMKLYQQYKDAPALYRATVTHEYKGMGGSHGLQNVQVGEVVEILQENVGPDRHYHLCRTTHGYYQQIGWYPVPYLQADEEASSRRWWWGWWQRKMAASKPE